MSSIDSTTFPALQDMLSSYFYPGGEIESLWERMERVKADDAGTFVPEVRRDIARFLGTDDSNLDRAFDKEFVSYYWPGGDGLTARAWLEQVDALLAAPPDRTQDHRSGQWG